MVVGINVLETPVVLDILDVVTSVVTPVDGLAVGVPDVVLPGLGSSCSFSHGCCGWNVSACHTTCACHFRCC